MNSLEKAADANVEAVRAALLERSKVGLSKYGVTTERDDLSPVEWVTHAQQEAMDLSVYLERVKAELSNKAHWKRLCMALLNNKYARHNCENSAVKCECGLTELKQEIQKLCESEMSKQEKIEKGLK